MVARVPDGKELMQVLLAMEVVQEIRVRSAMLAIPPGRVIEAAILGTKRETPLQVSKPKEPKPRKASAKRETPELVEYNGKPWDQARLSRHMEKAGLSGRELAEQLESRKGTPPQGVQVNRWCRGAEGIPQHYWPQLEGIFGGGK